MNVYKRTDFVKAAQRLGCPNYPSERLHYPPGDPYVPSPIPEASEENLRIATERWTTEINSVRSTPIGGKAVAETVVVAA